MASLKGGTSLWSAQSISQNAKSANANIGPGPWVCVYIQNATAVACTFKVQVAGVPNPAAGRNALDNTADGGLTWMDYIPAGETSPLSISVGASGDIAQDLSPFAPELMRLVRTDNNGAATVTAFVTAFGPN